MKLYNPNLQLLHHLHSAQREWSTTRWSVSAVRGGLMHLVEADNSASLSHRALRGNYSTGLPRGECLSALVKTRGKCYLVLTYSLIHAHWGRLIVSELGPFTFSLDTVTHTVYSALQKSIAQPKASPFFYRALVSSQALPGLRDMRMKGLGALRP